MSGSTGALIYKLTARVADVGGELAAAGSVSATYDRRAIGRLVKQLDERRKAAVEQLKRINQSGITVTLVEQNVPLALRVADRGYVLKVGKIILEGDSQVLRQSDLVQKAYLGE